MVIASPPKLKETNLLSILNVRCLFVGLMIEIAFFPTIASIGLRLVRTFTLFLEVGTAMDPVALRYIGRLVVMTPIRTRVPDDLVTIY